MKFIMNSLKLVPGFLLIAAIIYILLNPLMGHYIVGTLPIAVLGFAVGLYGILGDKSIWVANDNFKNIFPFARILFLGIGMLAVLYSFIALIVGIVELASASGG